MHLSTVTVLWLHRLAVARPLEAECLHEQIVAKVQFPVNECLLRKDVRHLQQHLVSCLRMSLLNRCYMWDFAAPVLLPTNNCTTSTNVD